MNDSHLLPTYARTDFAFERGEGCWLITTEGERYLDLGGGIAVNSLGHAHPHLVAELKAQADKLWHTSNLYRITGGERLAERLSAATFADRVFFTNSGVEAIECAIKMARHFQYSNGRPERYRIITFLGAFHGRTLATIAAGGQAKHLEGFGPKVDGFDQVPLGDLDAVRAAITPETAAVLIEPIQGEGGIVTVERTFLKALRTLCSENGLLLILDEIQCGMGRTGRLFFHENADIRPDVMAVAKGIGGGFPVGACLATEEASRGMVAGTHGSTFGGNPLAMAVANAVLDIVLADGFLEAVRARAAHLQQKLAGLMAGYPGIIAEIRGEGLMVGLKCSIPNSEVVAACLKQKLLTVPGGDNVVRLLPPLIISNAEIDEAARRIDAALRELADRPEFHS